MKTKLLTLIAIAFTFTVSAQTTKTTTTTTYKKAIALPAKPQTFEASANAKEYFKMDGNQVRAVKGGIPTFMPADRWLSNETVITPSGTVLTASGTKIYLQDGETIDGDGVITSQRCSQISPAAGNGGTCMIQ